jgi:ABC-type phosphate transport system ATPase subunit
MENLTMTPPEGTVMEGVQEQVEPAAAQELAPASTFQVKNLSIWYGEKRAIDNVSMDIVSNAVAENPHSFAPSTACTSLCQGRDWRERYCSRGRIFIRTVSIPQSFAAA